MPLGIIEPARSQTVMQQISLDWWIGIDESYHSRVEDGSLVFWKSERTIWINIWKDREGGTPQERLHRWIADRDANAADLWEREDQGLFRFGYLLKEPEEEGGERFGLYSYTVSESSTVQMVCYFDLKEGLGWASAVSKSLSFGGPDPLVKVDEPLGEDGHLVLASEMVIGVDRDPVLFAYREPPDNQRDSGWRFFGGNEDEAFTSDPNNIALCPLSAFLKLDPSLRVIINSPTGTAWARATKEEPWSPAGTPPIDKPEWR
jgi:hypothetical protein